MRTSGRTSRRWRACILRPRQISARDRRQQEPADREARSDLRAAREMLFVGRRHRLRQEIDQINIYWARMLAMTRAVRRWGWSPPGAGRRQRLPEMAAAIQGHRRGRCEMPLHCRRLDHCQGHPRPHHGRLCAGLSRLWLGDNRGYGTPHHWRALRELGPTPLHRRSFPKVRAFIEGEQPTRARFRANWGGHFESHPPEIRPHPPRRLNMLWSSRAPPPDPSLT